ncbi:MAG: alkaline phosphatase family protein [Chloroflexi bacterium]|nr:alkaline phosphatase family protein [Chloroflexota bacterium]
MKTVLIGFDAFDPQVFENLLEKDELPNLKNFIDSGSYQHLAIANPAQSEVSWTSIATGLNPAGHGLFDFVHRNPKTYGLEVSLLPTSRSVLGTQFTQPHQAKTFFDEAVSQGYPATSLWWPATFPARLASPVQSIPGLGTPDIFGQLGVGSFFTTETGLEPSNFKSRVGSLKRGSKGEFSGILLGPGRKTGSSIQQAQRPFSLQVKDDSEATLTLSGRSMSLKVGEWSQIFEVNFKLGMLSSVNGITRAIFITDPEPHLYFLPLQIHPLHSPWAYAAPPGLAKQAWKESGPFLTLGWPQDTTALEEGIINDAQFLSLCEEVLRSRERVFMQQLDSFKEGILAIVFDTLDRVQHMFFNRDKDTLAAWYKKLDSLFGRIQTALTEKGHADARILIMSDHGFAPYEQKVHLNKWLLEQGWLNVENKEPQKNLKNVEWKKTRAYALGLNSLYINLEGRERQGAVGLEKLDENRQQLRDQLLNLNGPDGRSVFDKVWLREEVFDGPHVNNAPDIVLGYSVGYRASAETGLGGYGPSVIEANTDHWNADHCINPEAVPGVLMANFDLGGLNHPGYQDVPEIVLGEAFETGSSEPTDGELTQEEQDVIEERMKGLGYL